VTTSGPRPLDGRVAVVTGACGGLGREIVRRLVAAGARVLATDVAGVLPGRTGAEDPAVRHRTLDVTSAADWRAAVDEARETFGLVDVLVNNAGIAVSGPIVTSSLDDFRRVMEVNLLGTFNGIQAVAPDMMEARRGSIVNVSSLAGMKGWHLAHAYTASKFAVRGLTKSTALELAAYGVRVNSVHPGRLDTAMSRGRTFRLEAVPLGRAGRPADIGGIVVFLASDDAAFSTGAEYVVDGGELAGLAHGAFVDT
jgi:Dehydrogenases with different specificities (related to short-chain alcohol dehydrogenases)